MNKIVKALMAVALAMVLVTSMAACAPKEEEPVASTDPAAAGQQGAEREMPLTTQLIMGTIMLEGTANEVTSEQAAELVPLWKGYVAVSESESASRLELDGVAEQISDAMTDKQMDAIESMDLSMENMQEVLDELGIEMGGGLTDEQRAAMEEARSSGQTEGGMMRPGGGGGGGMGGMQPPDGGNVEGMDPTTMQTRIAERQAAGGAMGGGMMGGTAMVEALIEVLSAKL